MKKKLTAISSALILSLFISPAFAKKYSCEITEVDGETVTLQCKKTDGLEKGTKIKFKTSTKKAIEGC
jgi:hypothetical protein